MPLHSPPRHTIFILQALRGWLYTTTSGMGTSSPTDVLRNLIRILEGASPRLRLAIALATPWAMLMGALTSYGKVWQALNTVRLYITSSIHASVRIPGSHSLQRQVLAYVVEQGLGRNARSLTLSPPQRDVKQLLSPYLSAYDNIYGAGRHQRQQRHTAPEDDESPPLSYVPQVGDYVFWWRGNRITLRQESREYQERDAKGRYHMVMGPVADIELSCLSLFGGAGPIRDFLKFVQNIPTKERTTTIYRPQGTAWDTGIVQSARSLNAVTMNSSIKDELVRDVETFLAPATKKYYANRGIAWRRGLLFYGPPGTGKTSFANAIAGHFNLNVYMISLSTKTLSDDMLGSLFEQLPCKCIVLLEDIDSAGIKRENMRQKRREKAKKQMVESVDENGDPIYLPPPTGITLSGLLNVLDGIHSREGMITIMTSNTPDSLDPALVRPGRIDRKVLFSFASREVSAKLFRHIFEKTEEEKIEGLDEVDLEYDISVLSEHFADMVPANKLTPGDVQGFLLVHRADPAAAVATAGEWARKTLEIKAKGANVASFEGESNSGASRESIKAALAGNEQERNDSAHEDDDTTSEDTTASHGQRNLAQMQTRAHNTLAASGRSPYSPYRPTSTWPSTYPMWSAQCETSRAVGNAVPPRAAALVASQAFAPFSANCGASQPTPPYSRDSSWSPPTTDEASSQKGRRDEDSDGEVQPERSAENQDEGK